MLKGRTTLQREIAAAQSVFRQFGIVPLAFRPPVGITNSRLWRVLLENGMFCVNFSCRAADFGNRRVARLAHRLLAKVVPGDIILLHDVAPRQGDVTQLLQEFSDLIAGLKEKGLEILPLGRLIGKEVMQWGASDSGPNPAEQFYNGLAATYDQEQFTSTVSLSRTTEYKLFSAQLPTLFAGANRVLEIGAGTGIFTLDIARNCTEVLAADISGNMLELLKEKADAAGIGNIRISEGERGNDGARRSFFGRLRLFGPGISRRPPRLLHPTGAPCRAGRGGLFHYRPQLPVPVLHADRQRHAPRALAEGPQPPGDRSDADGGRVRAR